MNSSTHTVRARLLLKTVLVAACIFLAVVWPNWRVALAAQAYGAYGGTFDFAVDWISVDGNVNSGGNPNGTADFFDDFNDGSIYFSSPTVAFSAGYQQSCLQDSVTTESGGFLRLIGADSANTLSPGFLVDNCILGYDSVNAKWRLRDGAGSSIATASFRADTPPLNQAYGIQLITLGTDQLVNIQVVASGSSTAVLALYKFDSTTPAITSSVPVNLTGIQRIFLRLAFDDATNTVTPSFSLNGGVTFTTIQMPTPGKIMTGKPTGAVSLFASQASGSLGTTDLLDPVSTLLTNSGSDITTNLTTLAKQGTRRSGVISDGLTRLVIRYNAPGPGVATIRLVDKDNNPLTDSNESGFFTDLNSVNQANAFTTHTQGIGATDKAFAIYRAPSTFARSGVPSDLDIPERAVYVQIHHSGLAGVSDTSLIPIKIVRPPIMFVHGIWSDKTTWEDFKNIPSSRNCIDSSSVDQGAFYSCRVDYSAWNASTFAESAASVEFQIIHGILQFKAFKDVAALQADVVAHSMGGDIVRTIPLCGTVFLDCNLAFPYRNTLNMNRGFVHKLITIGTPHDGTELANQLFDAIGLPCYLARASGETKHVYLETIFRDDYDKPIDAGAVSDLRAHAATINGLNSSASPFSTYYIAGKASRTDEDLISKALVQKVNAGCGFVFTSRDVRTILGGDSDLIVPVTSQLHGNQNNSDSSFTASLSLVHSSDLRTFATELSGLSGGEVTSSEVQNQVRRVLGASPVQ